MALVTLGVVSTIGSILIIAEEALIKYLLVSKRIVEVFGLSLVFLVDLELLVEVEIVVGL